MATKSKSSIKLIVWALLLALGLNAVITALNYGGIYLEKDYFHTHEFQYEQEQFLDSLMVFELSNFSEELAIENITVTAADIEEHRYRYGDLSTQIADIKNQYEYKIQEALAVENTAIAEAYTGERDAKIEDITRNFSDDNHVYEKVLKEKEERIKQFIVEREKYRGEFENFKKAYTYYLVDQSTSEVFTNIPNPNQSKIDQLFQSGDMVFSRDISSVNFANRDYIFYGNLEIPSSLKRTSSMDGKIGVTKDVLKSSPIWHKYHYYDQTKRVFLYFIGIGLIALLLSLFLYRKLKISTILPVEKWSTLYKKIPIDTALVLFVILALVSFITLMIGSAFQYYPNNLLMFIPEKVAAIIGLALLLVLLLIKGRLLFNRIKNRSNLKQDIQNSALVYIYRLLHDAFLNRKVGTQVFILLSIIFFLGGLSGVALSEVNFFLPFIVLIMIVMFPIFLLLAKKMGYFNQIIAHVKQMSLGNLVADLPINGKSVLAEHAKHINLLNQEVKATQNQQAKSERLKTELITNVSHDLRTPLTSIITYTELLKTPDLSIEDQKAYVEIIDRKSKRLKVLIDDLFEASKMASGNIELDKTQVDLVSLLQQALAEHDEKINESTLQFRVNHPHPPIYVEVDGQKMWRVFDNLIGNILKYSLENTRVYISILVEEDHVIITFKNVTKYELGENVDELLERFKRGDTSRNTEGSGLGLAIAKSIIDLHDGRLDIDIDGDLFKVTIKLMK